MDALEPAREMLDLAKTKCIYKEHICAAISDDKTDIPDGKYLYNNFEMFSFLKKFRMDFDKVCSTK